jgi:hypothetical protein
MGTIIRASIGFAIALTMLQGTGFGSGFDTSRLRQIRADIASERPAVRIVAAVRALLPPQKGTEAAPSRRHLRARDLQS